MTLKKFFEFKQEDLDPIESFKLQDDLNDKVWNEDQKMITEIREQLMEIANDFYEGTELGGEVDDIILTGSLANYNWSAKYSDFDVHILVDFKKINNDVELVKKAADGAKNAWNRSHDIEIEGYEVEVYIQDTHEPHISNGVYSILNNKWNKKPSKVEFELDEADIERKGTSIMSKIDDLETQVDELEYDTFIEKIQKVWEKVKDLRKVSLKEEGEFGVGNLVFKLLRRNGYIGKIIDLKKDSYDNKFG